MNIFKTQGPQKATPATEPKVYDHETAKFSAEQIARVLQSSRSLQFKMMLVDDMGGFNTIEVRRLDLDILRRSLLKQPRSDSETASEQKKILTTQEAADILGCSRPYIISEIKKGNLRCSFIGKSRRIAYSDVVHFGREKMNLPQFAKIQT